jgi:peptidoglycan/LPS O-acetylase OafA/YrhL
MISGTGVIVFFIISGLLISRSLLSKLHDGGYGFGQYFIDRFSRIYSGLIPCLLVITAVDLAFRASNPEYYSFISATMNAPDGGQLGMNLLMLQQFDSALLSQLVAPLGLSFPSLGVGVYGFNLPLWSLAIEWWLYMLFGWVVIGWFNRRNVNSALFAGVLVILLVMMAGFLAGNIVLISLWFTGVAITLLISYPELRAWTREVKWSLPILVFILMTSIVGSVIRMAFAISSEDVLVDPVLAVFLSMIVFSTLLILDNYRPGSEGRPTVNAPRKFFAFGASYSYTLYLVHFPLILFIDGAMPSMDKSVAMLVTFAVSNLAAVPVALLTEARHREMASWLKKKLKLPDPT